MATGNFSTFDSELLARVGISIVKFDDFPFNLFGPVYKGLRKEIVIWLNEKISEYAYYLLSLSCVQLKTRYLTH